VVSVVVELTESNDDRRIDPPLVIIIIIIIIVSTFVWRKIKILRCAKNLINLGIIHNGQAELRP